MFEKETTNCPRNKREVTITHHYEQINGANVDISHSCPLRSEIGCDGTEDGVNKCHLIRNYKN
nr:MAG TPA: hypothetical protein [Caudoviricetes sp.]